MRYICGWGAAVLLCMMPLIGTYIYTIGPEWVQLGDGVPLTTSIMFACGFCLFVVSKSFTNK